MDSILTQLSQIGIVPVIQLERAEDAVPLAKALMAGGLPCAEITFRTAAGEEAIRKISQEVPEMLVGAGTVLTTEQAERAQQAGAKFIVSPGLNPKVVAYCQQHNLSITPGCANPSDIEAALELGLEAVKFFPAEQAGWHSLYQGHLRPIRKDPLYAHRGNQREKSQRLSEFCPCIRLRRLLDGKTGVDQGRSF